MNEANDLNCLKPYIEKYRKYYNKKNLITKQTIKKKIKNSHSFSNVKSIDDNGIIKLKTGEFASIIEITPIDLSLSSDNEKESFFYEFRDIFKIKNLKLKCYKLDKKINLNKNKEQCDFLINKFENDKKRISLLKHNLELIKYLEDENHTLSSCYYFVIIANNIELLKQQLNEFETIINNLSTKIYIEIIENKFEVYDFLCNLYSANINLEQLLWLDFNELISPCFFEEKYNSLQIDDKEIQLIAIKKLPPFISSMFLNGIFNLPNVKVCLNINDSLETDNIINRIDKNYTSLLSDRMTTKKLSDVTEIDLEKENYQLLMNELKNGNEIVKSISLIIIIEGTKTERENTFKELKRLSENNFQITLDIPKFRQLEAWKCFDITPHEFQDYSEELPTLTISASFPFTKTHFNDFNNYILGYDLNTDLPIFFDPFYLNKKSRTSHNIAIVSTTGGGKSFTIKKLVINEFARGSKIFILDPENEYEKLVKSNGGEYIDLYSKKNGIINPLQIRYTSNDEKSKNNDFPLPKHLGFLESFFKTAFDNISEKELVTLLAILESLYNKKGIHSTTSIQELEKLKNTDYPIFSDLLKFIPNYKKQEHSKEKIRIINQLEILLERFLTGTDAYLFDGYTTIDLSNDLIAFNMKELLYSGNKRLINIQTINLLTYLSNAIITNKMKNDMSKDTNKKTICVIADEFHLFIDEKNCEILRNFGQLARRIRKYTGSLIVATQSIEDFIGNTDVLRHAKAIFNNCQYQLIGMLKEADILAYLELFKENPLTEVQKSFLLKANQGEFLFNINRKKRLKIKISSTPFENKLMGEEN